MPNKTQDYAHHAAFFPMFHFFASPITMAYAIRQIVVAVRSPGSAQYWDAAFAIGVMVAVFASRLMALKVQDRVIRLEMRLRLKEILPPALFARFGELRVRQIIGLRFASDAEMPALVERVLKGELVKEKEIKQAVKDWQPDYLRA